MKLTLVAGARPNFMKIASIIEAIDRHNATYDNIRYRLVHTGQHYDRNMSEHFFEQLGIPRPHVNLESGGGSQAEQTANIMTRFEKDLAANPTDLVLVVGDVTSTLACSIVAKKMMCDVAHVEAGIRSFDMTMPEEINRLVTDSITDHYFTTSDTANHNLKHAGIPDHKVHFVGNTMIDTLLKHEPRFIKPALWDSAHLSSKNYFVTTLHRPANVDDEQKLAKLIAAIMDGVRGLPVIFPVHPRTAAKVRNAGVEYANLFIAEPMPYLEFNYLVKHAKAVITDSGGITEETTVMHVPCITLRDNTERPETVETGTNELIGTNPANLPPALDKLMNGQWKKGAIPPLWDGKTSDRIVAILNEFYN